MQYKADYRPHEILHPDGVWRPGEEANICESGENRRILPGKGLQEDSA
jgi:hypothetical protein